MNLLFVCSKNQWRSPTAEQVFKSYQGIHTRSAGTSASARHRINSRDIAWADLILVMEERHKDTIKQQFPLATQHRKMVVLDIADDYHYMDAQLVELLTLSVTPYLPA